MERPFATREEMRHNLVAEKNGALYKRCLKPTCTALIELSAMNLAISRMATFGTNKAFRPAHLKKRITRIGIQMNIEQETQANSNLSETEFCSSAWLALLEELILSTLCQSW